MAARLLDVAPDGTETLVARQLFRPAVGTARQVFQLHPSGYLFAPGHVAEARAAAEATRRRQRGRRLRAPRERPGGHHGFEPRSAAARARGPGRCRRSGDRRAPRCRFRAARRSRPQFSSDSYLRATLGDGKLRFKGRTGKVPVDSAPGLNPCQVQIKLLGSGKAERPLGQERRRTQKVLGRGGKATIPGGQSALVKLKLSKTGPRPRSGVARGITVQVTTVDPQGNTVQTAKVKPQEKASSKKQAVSRKAHRSYCLCEQRQLRSTRRAGGLRAASSRSTASTRYSRSSTSRGCPTR